MPAMTELEIDGSTLEGGGQVLRCCLSLAWLHEAPVRIHSIRAARPKPGLAKGEVSRTRVIALIRQKEPHARSRCLGYNNI